MGSFHPLKYNAIEVFKKCCNRSCVAEIVVLLGCVVPGVGGSAQAVTGGAQGLGLDGASLACHYQSPAL